MLADILGTFVRGIGYRVEGFDSSQHLQDFLLLRENQDPRVCAPNLLLGAVEPFNAGPSGGSRSRRNPRGVLPSEFVVQFIDVSVALNEAESVLKNLSVGISKGI